MVSLGLSASEEISRLLFVDQNCLLSCGRTSGTVTVWDLRAGQCLRTIDSCSTNQSQTAWTCDQLARGGPMSTLLLLASDGKVRVLDVRSGCQKRDIMSLSIGQTFPLASHEHMTIRASTVVHVCNVFSMLYFDMVRGGRVVRCRTCDSEVVGSTPACGCCVPMPTQRAIPLGSVNEYQQKLGSKRAYNAMH